jgi:hypothetical protein
VLTCQCPKGPYAAANPACAPPRSILVAQAGEMRVAQIEVPLYPAPRLVFQLAAAIKVID